MSTSDFTHHLHPCLLDFSCMTCIGPANPVLVAVIASKSTVTKRFAFHVALSKASVSAQPQMRNRLRNSQDSLLLAVHRSQYEKQILKNVSIIRRSTLTSSESVSYMKRISYGPDMEVTTVKNDCSHICYEILLNKKEKSSILENNEQILRRKNDMRHRDLPITSTVHQKTLNENDKMNAFEHMPFQNDERSVERDTGLSVTQRDERLEKLQQLTSLKFEFVQTKTPISITSNEQPKNTSQSRQRSLILERSFQPEWPKTSQLPMLTVVMYDPQKSLNNHIVNNRTSQTMRQSTQASLIWKDQSRTDADDIRKILLNTNDIFLECCKNKNVNVQCESRCNFDILNRRVLTAMFIGSDPCPGSNGRKLLSCAAQDSDHTNCCRTNGVQRTTAGDKCLLFCQMSLESNFQADISMMPCWGVLHEIKQCFRFALIQNQTIKIT
ncbi:hypothetical protein DINM_004888 [Dirofilaria immitis]|nr:hypothetical protein [Dirofilaria immitis]